MKNLSVITVSFNCVNLIGATLKSVSQKKNEGVEHVVIDGGSTDGTVELIEEHRSELATFISERDHGIYDAMNKGIEAATGAWLLFLNAGDIFNPTLDLNCISFDWPSNTEFVLFPYTIEGKTEPNSPNTKARFSMPTSHQAMLISARVAKLVKLNTKFRVAADYDFYVGRHNLRRSCVFIENILLTRVLPGGYSKVNIETMKREYRQIIFRKFGIRHAIIYTIWSNLLLFKVFKKSIPPTLFQWLKSRFMI